MRNINYLRCKILKPFKSWRNKYLKYIGAKEAVRNNLFNNAVKEISCYTDEPEEVVERIYRSGLDNQNKTHLFRKRKQITKENIKNFYKFANFYIYDLPLWNAKRNRPGYLSRIIIPYLRRVHYKKVLDFGAGAGDLCIELASKGINVTYCDIADKLYDFANWRFANRNLNIKMIKALDETNELYDCILTFDVFEHLVDLPQAIVSIRNKLNKNGGLIFSGAFSGGGFHLEENEVYNDFRSLDRLMISSGFSFLDKIAQYFFYRRLK